MDTYKCIVVLNITNGFGNIVLNNIIDAEVPILIHNNIKPHGSVTYTTYWWDSGIFSHDLYLQYDLSINSYRLVKANSGKITAKILKYTSLAQPIIESIMKDKIVENFTQELKGKGIAVVLKSCSVTCE